MNILPRRPIPAQLKHQVFMLDNFTCVYCGYRGPDVTIDHFIPRVLNGPDVIENLYTACTECNSKKNDRPIYEIGMTAMFGRFRYVSNAEIFDKQNLPARMRPPRKVLPRSENDKTEDIIVSMVQSGQSANAIYRVIGGTRSVVLEKVKRAKENQENA